MTDLQDALAALRAIAEINIDTCADCGHDIHAAALCPAEIDSGGAILPCDCDEVDCRDTYQQAAETARWIATHALAHQIGETR